MSDYDDVLQTEKDENGIGKSYFPIEVRYEGSKEKVRVEHPSDLINGKGFVILRTRIDKRA